MVGGPRNLCNTYSRGAVFESSSEANRNISMSRKCQETPKVPFVLPFPVRSLSSPPSADARVHGKPRRVTPRPPKSGSNVSVDDLSLTVTFPSFRGFSVVPHFLLTGSVSVPMDPTPIPNPQSSIPNPDPKSRPQSQSESQSHPHWDITSLCYNELKELFLSCTENLIRF